MLAFVFAGVGIKILIKKNGKFVGTCASQSPFLNNLNEILLFSKKNEIKILLINNINYKGVNDDWLFYINLLIADFAKKNSLPFINLAKIKNISISDFYDDNHTTPEGSDKIAKFIYPEVANFLKTNE